MTFCYIRSVGLRLFKNFSCVKCEVMILQNLQSDQAEPVQQAAWECKVHLTQTPPTLI